MARSRSTVSTSAISKAASIHDLIGYVDQRTTLFNESVCYNISYSDPQASEEAIRQAAERADVSGFISEKEEGLNFNVGAKGIKLSGGQCQRVAIARAMLKNPPIMILDEATSALDNVTEQTVQKAINELMEDRTVLAIAHRLSTIKDADCIYVLDRGRIIEQGNHDSLLAAGGQYSKMWEHSVQGKSRMKQVLLILLMTAFSLSASALTPLEKKRNSLKLQISQTKLKLIQNNDDLLDIHGRILRMSRKLADQLEAHDSVKKLPQQMTGAKKKESLKVQITQAKLKLIQENEDFQELHQRILRLHRKLAVQLEADGTIKKLSAELAQVEAELSKAR